MPNLPKNTENPWFFEFQIVITWPKLVKIGRITHSKFRIAPYFHKKKILSSHKKLKKISQKPYPPPPKRPLWGGGGKIIKCRLRRLSLNMKLFSNFFFQFAWFFQNTRGLTSDRSRRYRGYDNFAILAHYIEKKSHSRSILPQKQNKNNLFIFFSSTAEFNHKFLETNIFVSKQTKKINFAGGFWTKISISPVICYELVEFWRFIKKTKTIVKIFYRK